jgi:hypothetical protein
MILQHAPLSETISTDQSRYVIRYSEPLSLIEISWQGLVTSDELQTTLLHLLEVINIKEPRYLLIDSRPLKTFGTEGQSWVANTFLPALGESTIAQFARISEPDVFTQAIVDSVFGYVQYDQRFGCRMCSFTDRKSAMDWLYS